MVNQSLDEFILHAASGPHSHLRGIKTKLRRKQEISVKDQCVEFRFLGDCFIFEYLNLHEEQD